MKVIKRFIATTAIAIALATGSSLAALAQTADPVTGEEGAVITAEQLENDAFDTIESVRVVDVEPLLAGARADLMQEALDASDPAAIRSYLERDTEVSEMVRAALREADVAEDDVVALVLHEESRLVVLYRRGNGGAG